MQLFLIFGNLFFCNFIKLKKNFKILQYFSNYQTSTFMTSMSSTFTMSALLLRIYSVEWFIKNKVSVQCLEHCFSYPKNLFDSGTLLKGELCTFKSNKMIVNFSYYNCIFLEC